MSAPLDDEYAISFGSPMYALIEPMLMMDPLRCCFMQGMASRMQIKAPRTLVAKISSQISELVFSMFPRVLIAALLTSTSIRP